MTATMVCKDIGEAFRAFERWSKEVCPDGDRDILELAIAYSRYAEKNGIEKYLDAAQPASSPE